jgi:hypothetical protein
MRTSFTPSGRVLFLPIDNYYWPIFHLTFLSVINSVSCVP